MCTFLLQRSGGGGGGGGDFSNEDGRGQKGLQVPPLDLLLQNKHKIVHMQK